MSRRYDPKNIEAVLRTLSERWPLTFFIFERRRRPLALRIDQKIAATMADTITSDDLTAALRHYTSNLCYLHACREGAARIDLDGNVVGTVTAAEAEYAAKVIVQRQAKSAAKRLTSAQTAALAPRPEQKRISLADLRAAALQRKAAHA
jgi:ProP effector